ncbi:ATP synthase F1 subunit epsilon [Ostreibacterium oceani]|uniref:ATP synthase epsilon chain n=1 Tax=Ostreibacterium oceani TaxID=2654998 RepID=A0A6N7EV14_9GAMM|nr:ATP synthase F1 subunit epsilon [Ostreibacterium oceani]MPV86614.1 ATP synthase F1 subunit epsilon [Ostreibacterium oceani]
MANKIAVELVNVDNSVLLSTEADLLIATATTGEVGIMHGHIPFFASLKPGHVIIKNEGKADEAVFISGGFIEVQPQKVTVLADTAERFEALDEMMAEQAKREAESELRSATGPDFERAQMALAEASARLSLIKRLHK